MWPAIATKNVFRRAKILADIACVAPEFAQWTMQRLDQRLACAGKLRAAWEQEPLPENRIELSDELDMLGVPRPILYWKKSERDRKTVQVAARSLATYLAASNSGRVRLASWLLDEADYPTKDELGGNHHMGGTRMAETPDEGVVDANCKVFGQENLYVAGSSVFPSSGHANPTLTIVQLALRLADHLKARGQ